MTPRLALVVPLAGAALFTYWSYAPRCPLALDRFVGVVIMTPGLHRIYHSARASQRDSNWSSGLTLWDHLHGTHRRDGDARWAS